MRIPGRDKLSDKNSISLIYKLSFVCLFGNKWLSLHLKLNIMEAKTIKVILSEEAESFVRLQPIKAQQKITYNIRKLESGVMDNNLFKKLGNSEIWELRTLFSGICYRLFAFWDTETETLVVATHGIIKKTQKTPQKEIQRAEEIRKEYFNEKIIYYDENEVYPCRPFGG